MGRAAAAAAVVVALSLGAVAAADPVFPVPVVGKARWGEGEDDPALVGLMAEMRAVGVLAGDRLAQWPARRLGLEPGIPALIAARGGVVVDLHGAPWTLVARGDLSEPWRPYVDDGIGKIADAVVTDLYARWHGSRPIDVVVGRSRVPWSKTRQFDELDEPLGAPPFLVDRVAPDRRWGAMALADHGALGGFAGAWEDLDALEPRARVGDPSAGGALAAALGAEWTPAGPMMGSEPPGQVPGALGSLPTPRADPLFETARLSFGAGLLARVRRDGSARADAALSAQLKWRWLAGILEVLGAHDGTTTAGGHAEVMITPIDRIALSARAEIDPGAPAGGEWSVAAGLAWHVTKDRRNRIALVGWLRRDRDRGTPYDGLVVFLQASL